MSILIDCPSCRRKLRVPEEYLGKSVRCPTCGETFGAPEPAAAAAAPAPAPTATSPTPLLNVPLTLEIDDERPTPPEEVRRRAAEAPPARKREPEPEEDDDEPRGGRRHRRREFEPCPGCREDIRRGAVVCPYCGLDLEEQGDGYTRRRPVRRDAEPHRGSTVQGLGIASLVLAAFYVFPIGIPLGIAAWVMGRRDLQKMELGEMDPNGRKKTKDGWLCGLIGTLLNSLWAFGCVGLISVSVLAGGAFTPPPAPPPPVMVPPPLAWNGGPPQANNFTLSGPPAVVFLRPGEGQPFVVNVNRVAGFRGNVAVTVDQEPDGLDVTPGVAVVPGQNRATTFRATADREAKAGDLIVRLRATSDFGDDVRLDVRVRVVEP